MMAKAKRILDRWPVAVWAMIFGILVGTAGILVIGKTVPPPTFVVAFGGNTDPGDGNCGGTLRDDLERTGWTHGNLCQVQWNADISNTKGNSDAAMAPAQAIWDQHCRGNTHCQIFGFSLGSYPAIKFRAKVGAPPDDLTVFGAPQPSTGIWHHSAVEAGGNFPGSVEFWLSQMQLEPDVVIPAGSHDYYDTRDPYNNTAPQCFGPGIYALAVQFHAVIGPNDANNIWRGNDGVDMHEANKGAPAVSSGSDPSPPWAGCPLDDWHNTGQLPGIPGGSPIPSSGGNMPALPGLPGQPGG